MAACSISPKPEMYGLGIRVAFYIQWIGTIGFNYIDQTALPDLRLLGLCLSASMTLALLIQAANHALTASEMYVMVVLATGGYMFLVPVYMWRIITGCRCYWDPSYWTEEEPLRIYRVLNFTTVFVGACMAIWFFAAYLPGSDDACQQYGFMFGKSTMKSWSFVVLNAMLHVAVVAACAVILIVKWGPKLSSWESSRRRRRRRREKFVLRLYINNWLGKTVLLMIRELVITTCGFLLYFIFSPTAWFGPCSSLRLNSRLCTTTCLRPTMSTRQYSCLHYSLASGLVCGPIGCMRSISERTESKSFSIMAGR